MTCHAPKVPAEVAAMMDGLVPAEDFEKTHAVLGSIGEHGVGFDALADALGLDDEAELRAALAEGVPDIAEPSDELGADGVAQGLAIVGERQGAAALKLAVRALRRGEVAKARQYLAEVERNVGLVRGAIDLHGAG